MASKRSSKKTFRKTSRRPKRVAKKVSTGSGLKRMVKKLIQKSAEKKTVNYVRMDMAIAGSDSTTTVTNIIPVTPYTGALEIAQGTSQDERIGNRIQIQRLTIKGSVFAIGYDLAINPQPQPTVVQMFVYYDKTNPNVIPDPFGANDFFQFGGSSADFRNDVVDGWAPINKDRYVCVVRKKFKVGFATYGGTGIAVAQQSYTNNDFAFSRDFSVDLTKHCVSKVRYEDLDLNPSTRGLFCSWVCFAANGSAYPATSQPCRVSFSIDATYTDL